MAAAEKSQSEADFLDALVASQTRAIEAVAQALPAIERAAQALSARLADGGRLVYLGAGSSGLIAIQDGAELPGTFGLERSRICFVIAGGVARAHEIDAAAEDDAEGARSEIAALELSQRDAVVALSASGATPYTLAGAKAARGRATLIAIANRAGAPLLAAADHPILLESGREALEGSTRLAAGTAQRGALVLLSTLANARLGHVYRGLMVNVRPENDKLRKRALGVIAAIAGVDEAAARASLAQADGDVKCAVLIAAGARGRPSAAALVESARGDIGVALSRLSAREGRGAEF